MANETLNCTLTSFYNTATDRKTGVGSGSGSTAAIANANAKNAANANAINALISPTIQTGGQIYTDSYRFGQNEGTGHVESSTIVSTTRTGSIYNSTASATASRTDKMWQLKLNFNIPINYTINLIKKATLKFRAAQNADNTTPTKYHICAPKGTTEQTNFQRYTTTDIIDKNQKVELSVTSSNPTDYSIDITNIFKQCVELGQGWLTILTPQGTTTNIRHCDITGTPTIEVEFTYTKNTAPTSITRNVSIQKPNGIVNIQWSGQEAGINNNISGYTIFWKVGGVPTETSYTDKIDTSASSYSFTIPSGATRNSIYYFEIVAKSGVGPEWDSDISETSTNVSVNNLPSAPSVSYSPVRLKSTTDAEHPTNVTFAITPGTDVDSSQTITTYYATSLGGTKVLCNTTLTLSLSDEATYYFWSYDGLEYSATYTTTPIRKNNAPTIGSVNMSAVKFYSPSARDGYAININGSASNITGTNLTYKWRLLTKTGSSGTPNTTNTVFSTASSFSNVDVTAYGANFNTSYRLQLTVTDDIGEQAIGYSTKIFYIPSASSIQIININDDNDAVNGNTAHFGRYIRIKSNINTGIIQTLQYSTSSSFSSFESIQLRNDIAYNDIDFSNLTRNTTYYFRVIQTCNSLTGSGQSRTLTRAKDITPNNISLSSSTIIKPYTNNSFSFSFGNQPTFFVETQDVSTSYADIYTISFVNGGNNLVLTSNGTNSSGTVTTTISDLLLITTTQWKNFIGVSNAPNASYNNIKVKIIAKNGFNEEFIAESNSITLNFIEEIYNAGTAELQIKTNGSGDNQWQTISATYSNKTFENRYPLFEGQTIRIKYSNLQAYANQNAIIKLLNNTEELSRISIGLSDWELLNNSHIYELNSTKYIEYNIPKRTSTINTILNLSIGIVLENGKVDTISSTGNLNTTSLIRFSPESINFKLTTIDVNNNNATINWTCSDYGASVSNKSYSFGYANVTAQLKWSSSIDNSIYNDLDSSFALTGIGTSSVQTSKSVDISSIQSDIIYFGIRLTFNLNFVTINSCIPTGTQQYIREFKGQAILYRKTPNLLYGENFFVLNNSQPKSNNGVEISNQLLSIYPTSTRKMIYLGEDGHEGTFLLETNGVIIDGFIINCGTWDA